MYGRRYARKHTLLNSPASVIGWDDDRQCFCDRLLRCAAVHGEPSPLVLLTFTPQSRYATLCPIVSPGGYDDSHLVNEVQLGDIQVMVIRAAISRTSHDAASWEKDYIPLANNIPFSSRRHFPSCSSGKSQIELRFACFFSVSCVHPLFCQKLTSSICLEMLDPLGRNLAYWSLSPHERTARGNACPPVLQSPLFEVSS